MATVPLRTHLGSGTMGRDPERVPRSRHPSQPGKATESQAGVGSRVLAGEADDTQVSK